VKLSVVPRRRNTLPGVEQESVSSNVVSSIRALLPSLREAEQRVARVVLADPSRVAEETIDRLAERAGTSTATVTRFYRSVGVSGFQQLRVQLATEVGRRGVVAAEMGSDIEKGDDLAKVVAKLCFAGAQAIQDTGTQLDIERLIEVIDLIERASRIDLYGAGASALVATDLQQKLYRIGRVSYAWSEAHMARTGAALLKAGDVAIGFSHSGETEDTVRSLSVARKRGATTVAVTNHPRSSIIREADVALYTASHEVSFRAAATSSRHAQLAIVDCIFMGLAQRTFDESRKALGETYLAVHGELLGE
jgi:DNA-binding MurR/RpiR family transcriptional regulator